jgi:2,4-dienoyl-CoA reductase-like NADH-dependent reductase (Old Yellow Enzyme family)
MTTLLSLLSFSGLSLRNRITMPPMWSGKATPEGLVTDAIDTFSGTPGARGGGADA